MAHVRNSREDDARLLAPNLRKADVRELSASTHLSPFEVLTIGHQLGRPCKTIIGDDKETIIGMFGVTPVPGQRYLGVIWCLTTDELFQIKMQFMRQCRKYIRKITKDYFQVFNFVYCENVVHIRWLKAMGFDVDSKPKKLGVKEENFFYFHKGTN